jgi:hypothetical protein
LFDRTSTDFVGRKVCREVVVTVSYQKLYLQEDEDDKTPLQWLGYSSSPSLFGTNNWVSSASIEKYQFMRVCVVCVVCTPCNYYTKAAHHHHLYSTQIVVL